MVFLRFCEFCLFESAKGKKESLFIGQPLDNSISLCPALEILKRAHNINKTLC